MKGFELAQHGGVVVRRNVRFAADPGIKVGIRHFDQPLEIIQRRFVKRADMGIGEATDDPSLKGEGKVQEAKGDLQKAVGNAKSAIKKAADL